MRRAAIASMYLLGWFLFAPPGVRQGLAQPAESAATVRPLAFSTRWQIRSFLLNNKGTAAFTAGNGPGDDSIFLADAAQLRRLVFVGDPVPGSNGAVFSGFSKMALNDQDEVAFIASTKTCGGPASAGCSPYGYVAGDTLSGGIFLYSGGSIRSIAGYSENLPGILGDLSSNVSSMDIWINKSGAVLFGGRARASQPSTFGQYALFLYEDGVVTRVSSPPDLMPSTNFWGNTARVEFGDDGAAVFYFVSVQGVFRWSKGMLQWVGPADGGETTLSSRGDTFTQYNGLTSYRDVRGFYANPVRDGYETPLGGTFAFSFTQFGRPPSMGSLAYTSIRAVINGFGEALLAVPIRGAGAPAALFSFSPTRGLRKVVASGETIPGISKALVFADPPRNDNPSFLRLTYGIHDSGMMAFTVPDAAVIASSNERLHPIAASGAAAPGALGGAYDLGLPYGNGFTEPKLNDAGQVVFRTALRGGPYSGGLFLATLPSAEIQNGSFETLGGGERIPRGWESIWSTSAGGDVTATTAAPFDGNQALRLHVGGDGGWTFALSEPIPVRGGTTYLVRSRMRYNLTSASDSALFTVFQYDAAGREIGREGIEGRVGANFWQWQPRSVMITTASDAAFIRIRFGLVCATENYLDVDAVK